MWNDIKNKSVKFGDLPYSSCEDIVLCTPFLALTIDNTYWPWIIQALPL